MTSDRAPRQPSEGRNARRKAPARRRDTPLFAVKDSHEESPQGARGTSPVTESGGHWQVRQGGTQGEVPSQTAPADVTLEDRTVYVIDSHSLIHQLFHAIPEMSSPAGQPVNAVFGFCRDLFSLVENRQVDFLFCAFDSPEKTFRHDLFEAYKEQRPEMDPDLAEQIPLILRLLEVLSIPALIAPGYEADDILATVARETRLRGGYCYLVTNDKDCRQLITDRVLLYNPRKHEVMGAEELQKLWQIKPEQVVDFQALVGDSSDNVPGVPLIGPKVAQELLNRYGTLDNLLEHAGEISGKRGQNLAAFREKVRESRELVRLDDHVPVEIPWSQGAFGGADRAAAEALFRELGFRRFSEQLDRWTGTPRSTAPSLRPATTVVDTPEALATVVGELREAESLSIDTETAHAQTEFALLPRHAELVGISLCAESAGPYYVPVRGPEGSRCLPIETVIEALRPVVESPKIKKVGQNLKFDMTVLATCGLELAGIEFDTLVASYLLDAGAREHNLDELAKRHLNHKTIKITDLIGKGKNQKRMDDVPVAEVAQYAGEDAWLPLRLRPVLENRLRAESLDRLFFDVEMPLVEVLAAMEYRGIRVDVARLNELGETYRQRMKRLEDEIYALAGEPFNIASPKQLAEVLFDRLKLPVVKRTKTGPSTDAEVLTTLALRHELPAKIVQYRQYAKLLGTYIDALPRLVHPETGRIHASFHQAVTATGRLSSSDPNLQNIPIRTHEGREIRSAFVAGEEGWLLLCADYSQIELRMLAHFSQDEQLLEAFRRGEDIHAKVAAQVYGVTLQEVTPEMRRSAKTVNFGVIYGQTPYGLAKQLGIDKDEAAEFINTYFATYPGIEEFLEATLASCRKRGYVTTILGRKRVIEGVRKSRKGSLTLPERTAINTVVQGSAADLIKLAMLGVRRRLRESQMDAWLLLQIHDELLFECPADEVHNLAKLAKEEMEQAMDISVPILVEPKVGPNWADAAPLGGGAI